MTNIDINAVRARAEAGDQYCDYGYPLGGAHPRIDWCGLKRNHTGMHRGGRDGLGSPGFTSTGTVQRTDIDVPALLDLLAERDAEIKRLRAVAEAAVNLVNLFGVDPDDMPDLDARQSQAEVDLFGAVRTLPATAGQPHYHDPIECACELTQADAPKTEAAR